MPMKTKAALIMITKLVREYCEGILHNAEYRYQKKPWLIMSVHTNGTITVQRGNKIDRMNIRRVKLFEEDLDIE